MLISKIDYTGEGFFVTISTMTNTNLEVPPTEKDLKTSDLPKEDEVHDVVTSENMTAGLKETTDDSVSANIPHILEFIPYLFENEEEQDALLSELETLNKEEALSKLFMSLSPESIRTKLLPSLVEKREIVEEISDKDRIMSQIIALIAGLEADAHARKELFVPNALFTEITGGSPIVSAQIKKAWTDHNKERKEEEKLLRKTAE